MQAASVIGFVAAVTPIALTPGASFTLATERALVGDRRGTAAVVLGTATGIAVHATLAGVGLSALVMASAEAFTVVRLAGAAYLIALGIWTIRGSFRTTAAQARAVEHRAPFRSYRQAVIANVLNPKAAAVYLTLAPQFLDAGDVGVPAMLLLAAGHIAVMAAWLAVWTGVLRTAAARVRTAPFRAWFDRVAGAVLVALGIRTAVA